MYIANHYIGLLYSIWQRPRPSHTHFIGARQHTL